MGIFTPNHTSGNSGDRQAPSGFDRINETADQVLLAQVAIQDDSGIFGEACVKERISDPALLCKIALEAVSGSVRQVAVRHAYFNDAALLEKIAMEDPDAAVRTAAVESAALSDPDALARIAAAPFQGDFLEPRWTAALKLSRRDPDRAAPMLIEFTGDEAAEERTWLFNETLAFLEKYRGGCGDPEIREAAEAVLKKRGRL